MSDDGDATPLAEIYEMYGYSDDEINLIERTFAAMVEQEPGFDHTMRVCAGLYLRVMAASQIDEPTYEGNVEKFTDLVAEMLMQHSAFLSDRDSGVQ